jgi:hypothetical protein
MCVPMHVHTQTVFITYATQVHTANMTYVMAIIQYHFSNFASPQIFTDTSIINHAIFFIDNSMVRRTVEYYRTVHRLA